MSLLLDCISPLWFRTGIEDTAEDMRESYKSQDPHEARADKTVKSEPTSTIFTAAESYIHVHKHSNHSNSHTIPLFDA